MATVTEVVNDIEWLWEMAIPDEAKRHLLDRISAMILAARMEERDRCAMVARDVADEELPEPYWDLSRARRMDWACACGRILGRIQNFK